MRVELSASSNKTAVSKPVVHADLLPPSGNLYKVNLHTHSTVSDGHFSPAKIKEIYQKHGYDAVAYSDHNICMPHNDLTDDRFVALTSMEVDFNLRDPNGLVRKVIHLNALARDPSKTDKLPPYQEMGLDLVNEVIERLKADDYIITLNHPVWSDMSTEDLLYLKGMHGVEITNSIGMYFNNYCDDSAYFEYFLRAGGRAVPVASDDCHRSFEDGSPFVEYCQSFTVLKAPELTYDALVRAFESGHLFASTGPMFENLWLDGDILHVQCSPVCGVFVHGKYLHYKAVELERSDCITETQLDIGSLRQISPYIWVQLRDSNGKKAWSVPFWFEPNDA